MNIAKYVASVGFDVNTRDIQKVDRALGLVEKKLKDFKKRSMGAFSIDLVNFNVNQQRLNRSLGNALDLASSKVAFEISNFVVDQQRLNRVMTTSIMQASRIASQSALIRPNTHATTHVSQQAPSGRNTRAYAGLGGIGLGLMGPIGYGALALAGGGYGLSALNQRNQEVVSAQLQAQAVVQQAGGTAEQGQASFQYLRSEANRIGFNYLESVGDYNKLLSGLTGSGMSVAQSQKVFSGFAELARVNKLDKVTQNRLFRALSQVAGKGKLQAEELTSQISEALPGGTALFARAYQSLLSDKGQGGGLTGQAAIAKLQADMKKGLVTSEILRYAGAAASEQANKGGAFDLAKTASQAEQQRYQNTLSDLAVVASSSGVEEGFARIFRTLNNGLKESDDLIKGLAQGFNEATKFADDLLLFPQSFIRALEGRDSLVADWLGPETVKQLQQDWKDIKQIFTDISNIKFDFLPTLKETSQEIAAILNAIAEFQRWKSGVLPTQEISVEDVETIDPFGTGGYKSPAGLTKAFLNNFGYNLNKSMAKSQAINDPNSIYFNDPIGYEQEQKDRAIARQEDEAMGIVNNNNVSIQVNVDAATLGNIDIEQQAQLLSQRIALNLEQVLVNFPNVE